MVSILTFDKLMSLPNEIIRISENNEFIGLLSNEVINEYYYLDLKKDLTHYMNRFNDMKFLYHSSNNFSIQSTSYSEAKNIKSKTTKSAVEEFVDKKVDTEKLVEEVYNHLISLSHKLNLDEQKYFIETFFKNGSEESISEKLGICRKTLQNIKKSCLVKMYLEINSTNQNMSC